MMDPLWSETCWSTFKYFIILIVSTYYILCISWIIKCLMYQANELFVFRRVRKTETQLKARYLSVCLSFRMNQLVFHWTDFHKIWHLSIFRKSVEKFEVSLKSNKNNGYFTWSPTNIYANISLKREGRTPTRCNNIDDLMSIVDVDYRQHSRHVSGIFMPISKKWSFLLMMGIKMPETCRDCSQ